MVHVSQNNGSIVSVTPLSKVPKSAEEPARQSSDSITGSHLSLGPSLVPSCPNLEEAGSTLQWVHTVPEWEPLTLFSSTETAVVIQSSATIGRVCRELCLFLL